MASRIAVTSRSGVCCTLDGVDRGTFCALDEEGLGRQRSTSIPLGSTETDADGPTRSLRGRAATADTADIATPFAATS